MRTHTHAHPPTRAHSQVGPFSCRTWRPHNILACLLWLPTLGAAAWLLADSAHEKSTSGPGAVEGGRLLEASLAMAVIMVTGHAVVIVAYCLRAHQRAKAMRELPTQQLLSCAQQATRSNLGPSAAAAGAQSSSTSPPDPPFRLQFGRSDGAFGYTLFIPAEQVGACLLQPHQPGGPWPGCAEGPRLGRAQQGSASHVQGRCGRHALVIPCCVHPQTFKRV